MGAEVRAADPHVALTHVDSRVTRIDLTVDELVQADAVVLVTDHGDFDFDVVAEHARYVLDADGASLRRPTWSSLVGDLGAGRSAS